jgi:XTP/dITP diphosphohydrolase
VKLFCATTNEGKLREFRAASGPDIEIVPLPRLRAIETPEESGRTFEENAILKGLYYGAHIPEEFPDAFLFAEDSGLEVDELCGEPGVYSARFAGPDATDDANNQLLLERLLHSTDRTARYVCVIALVKSGELLETFRGTVEGEITRAPEGSGGFGYDPLFYYPPFAKTFGETPPEQKAAVSHRAKALADLFAYLRR